MHSAGTSWLQVTSVRSETNRSHRGSWLQCSVVSERWPGLPVTTCSDLGVVGAAGYTALSGLESPLRVGAGTHISLVSGHCRQTVTIGSCGVPRGQGSHRGRQGSPGSGGLAERHQGH